MSTDESPSIRCSCKTSLLSSSPRPSPRQTSAGCRLPRLHRFWGGVLDGSSRTPSLSPSSVSRCIPSSARTVASPVNPPDLPAPGGRSLSSSIPSIAALLSRPERAEGAVLAVREIFALLVGAAHVPIAGSDGLDPMCVEELLDLPLDLWARCHIGCDPSLEDRLGVRRDDHPGSDLGRGLVVRAVESHCANGVLRALLWLAVRVGDRGRRSGLSSCDLLRKTTVLILPPAPTRTRIVAGDSVAIYSSPPT